MANNLTDFHTLIQKLRESAQNLSKDLDPQDKRDETKGDLYNLASSFQQMQKIFNSMDATDIANIKKEVYELLSKKQNFLECARDVNTILMNVKKKAENNKQVKEKIESNIPQQHKGKAPTEWINTMTEFLQKVESWTEQTIGK